jgi:hypothetical protein
MEDVNLILLVVGFFVGYFLKGFFGFRSAWSATGELVEKVGNQSLKLLGTTVYRVSYIDQLYKKAIEIAQGNEAVKIHNNELEHEFEIWKKKTMKVFVESYPEEFKWQLEATDWKSAMNLLTDIYKKEKLKENEKLQEHNG